MEKEIIADEEKVKGITKNKIHDYKIKYEMIQRIYDTKGTWKNHYGINFMFDKAIIELKFY